MPARRARRACWRAPLARSRQFKHMPNPMPHTGPLLQPHKSRFGPHNVNAGAAHPWGSTGPTSKRAARLLPCGRKAAALAVSAAPCLAEAHLCGRSLSFGARRVVPGFPVGQGICARAQRRGFILTQRVDALSTAHTGLQVWLRQRWKHPPRPF